jgi:hypothetical protein
MGILYCLTFLLILWLAYTHNLPTYLTKIDKAGHLGLYGFATYLAQRALNYKRLRLGPWLLPMFPTLFGLFTLVEECAQSLSPNRTFDGIDLVCSFIGIAVGYGLAQLSCKRSSSSSRP